MVEGDSPIPLDDETREVIRLLQAAAQRAIHLILNPPGKTDKSRSWHSSQAAARLAQINKQLDQVKAKLVSVTGKKITAAYREGINQAEQQAIDAGIRPAGGVIQGGFTAVDRRRATVLIRQTAKDLSQAVDSIKATTGKIVKQTQALGLDTREVNRLLAGGTLDGQPKPALRELTKLVNKAAIEGKIVTVNRNTGEMRTFKPDYYAEMVFQTKLAETTNIATIQRLRDKKILYVKIIGSSSRNFCTAFVGRVFYIGEGNDPKYGFPSIRQLPRGGPPFHPRCTKRYTAFIPALQGEEAIEKARLKPNEQELLNKPSSEAQKVFEGHKSHLQAVLPSDVVKNASTNSSIKKYAVTANDREVATVYTKSKEIAELIDEAMQDMTWNSQNPQIFIEHPETFAPLKMRKSPMVFSLEHLIIYINPDYASRPVLEQATKNAAKTGFIATSDPRYAVWQELAHAIQAVQHGKGWLKHLQSYKLIGKEENIALSVSQRAADNAAEFVAETFSLLQAGGKPSPAAMNMYKRFKGP